MSRAPDLVRQAAEALLDSAAGPLGFAAAVGDAHYDAVWTRDAAITCLGAMATGTRWDEVVARTLATVAERAAPTGLLPNTVWGDGWFDFGEHGAVDPTLWWCLAACRAVDRGVDGVDRNAAVVEAAVRWLRHLDTGGTGLVQQPGASDWMDSSVQRVGITLHANALFTWVLREAEGLGLDTGPGPSADEVAERLDLLLWPRPGGDVAEAYGFLPPQVRARGLPHPATAAAHVAAQREDRAHWASHLRWGHLVDVVDVLGNVLAVLAGVGTPDQHARVLDHLDGLGVADPYPSRTLGEPVVAGGPDLMFDAEADANQDGRWRNPPWEYHNAASWPMVGGFHAWALRRGGRADRADELAHRLSAACVEDGFATFPEWRHGRTGDAGGARRQTWSAAGLLLALEAS